MGRWCGFGLWLLGLAAWLSAQEPVPEGLTTIHAYANLIQMPTLVLDRWGDTVKPRAGQKFMVTLDTGKPFRATHVRIEGEDPITLAILIDVSSNRSSLSAALPDAIARLAPLSLLPHDHVSIYAIDCKVMRTLTDAPASTGSLKQAVTDALKAPGLHGEDGRTTCQDTRRLWDTLAYVTGQMQGVPGRRVILAVTDGRDKASVRTPLQLQHEAQSTGVAIFGLALKYGMPGPTSRTIQVMAGPSFEDRLDSLCQTSGGKVFTSDSYSLGVRLQDFVKVVRERYIVQFPREDTLGAGSHYINIAVAGQDYVVRPAGISVPIADAKEVEAKAAIPVGEPEPVVVVPVDPVDPR